MADEREMAASSLGFPAVVAKVRARTPARLLVGRSGASYRTNTLLDLREAHAAARDAVRSELNLGEAFGSEFARRWNLFELRTKAVTKEEYLLRPDLGRELDERSRLELKERGASTDDVFIAVGDGLSVAAVAAQVPRLLPVLQEGARSRRWAAGGTPVIRYCRVGILNHIGELLKPRVAVLLIGERPGLATAASLSAYIAYRPCGTHTDANRNVISNIHERGLTAEAAASHILDLAERMMKRGTSGYQIKLEAPEMEIEND